MQIKLQSKLKGLDGKELEIKVGEALSNIILQAESGGKMKLYILGQKFYNDKTIELDDADIALTKSAIESSKVYNALVTGQLLLLLEKSSEKKDAKEETK